MRKIIDYLIEKYKPTSILVMGSYADGSNDEMSDFDCIVITDEEHSYTDRSVLNEVELDCKLYSKREAIKFGLPEFVKAHDATIILDDGFGLALKEAVNEYLESIRIASDSVKKDIVTSSKKTISRVEKGDDDGNFRAAYLLWESLVNYFVLRDKLYFGSKKSIAYLKSADPKGYEIFHDAVTTRGSKEIIRWAEYVINI